jgi:hypothetical protein
MFWLQIVVSNPRRVLPLNVLLLSVYPFNTCHIYAVYESSVQCISLGSRSKISVDVPLLRSAVYNCGNMNASSCPAATIPNWNFPCHNRVQVPMVIWDRNHSKPNPKQLVCSKVLSVSSLA